jgi:DMSO reductase anchor subunit
METMDNWLFLMLGLVLVIPLSILANLATPWVKSYFKNWSLTTRERKINILLKEFRYINELYEDKNAQIIYYLRAAIFLITFGLFSTMFLLLALWDYHIMVKLMALSMVFLSMLVFTNVFINLHLKKLKAIDNFEEYKQQTREKLIKLGGNLEDLDKEESEG